MTQAAYRIDRQWSDRYIPELAKVLGPLLIKPAPLEIDMKEATDLMVLTTSDIRIAARVRRPGYAMSYPDDFTIRFKRHDTNVHTEIDKIMDGFADWMIYAHAANGDEPKLAAWMVVDLHAFRHHVNFNPDSIYWQEKNNLDNTTSFLTFNVKSFPEAPPILIARYYEQPLNRLMAS